MREEGRGQRGEGGRPTSRNEVGDSWMEKVRVYFDREGSTLNVWFDDPKKEHVCEETGDDMILVKDPNGRTIGFELLNLFGRSLCSALIPDP
jgi:hypothetical protein